MTGMQRWHGVLQLLGAGARACASGSTRSEHALAGGLISRGVASSNPQVVSQSQQALPAASAAVSSWLRLSSATSTSAYHTSSSIWQATAPTTTGAVTTPDAKYDHLADKDIWDEAWAYEPRFGTADNPIQVPALLSERIIGVTDPDDDTLVIWGIIREGEPPKQLVAGGEFFVLQRVSRVDKVGDKLGIPL